MPEMSKRKLADRVLDEIVALRHTRGLVVEFDEESADAGSASGPSSDEIAVPAARRQIVVES
jgi:hypothetical protein